MSPDRLARAETVIAEQRGRIELPVVESQRPVPSLSERVEGPDHHLLLVDLGVDALALRLHLIRAAESEILLQNYIFLDDSSGALILAELIAAARRGVRVRVLVDALFSLAEPELQAALELADRQFELRLHNPLFHRARLSNAAFAGAIVCCFKRLNRRMHHKLLVVDGQHGLIGGRNSADRYFDLDTRMNFVDLEVLVSGPVVADMVDGFDVYWDHPLSQPPRRLGDVVSVLLKQPPAALTLAESDRLSFAAERAMDPEWLDALLARRGLRVREVEYFKDPPDKWRGTDRAGVADSTTIIHDLLGAAERELLIQTPYFVMSPRFERLLGGMAERGVAVTVSTNSLAATDAWPVHAISRRQHHRKLADHGVTIWEAKPFPASRHALIGRYPELIVEKAAGYQSQLRGDPMPATRPMPGPRISLHAKVAVIDGRIGIVTSHNFDPRSEIFNTENGLIVHDAAFAAALAAYIDPMLRPQNAWLLAEQPIGDGWLAAANRAMARGSRRMPSFDLWPAYLVESYQLPTGAEPVNAGDPAFHKSWVGVGLSPEVVRGQRRFLTALVSRMFGFLWPIM